MVRKTSERRKEFRSMTTQEKKKILLDRAIFKYSETRQRFYLKRIKALSESLETGNPVTVVDADIEIIND